MYLVLDSFDMVAAHLVPSVHKNSSVTFGFSSDANGHFLSGGCVDYFFEKLDTFLCRHD